MEDLNHAQERRSLPGRLRSRLRHLPLQPQPLGMLPPLLGIAVLNPLAVFTLASGEPFWHQLVLVLISSIATIGGAVLTVTLAARHAERKIARPLRDISRHTGTDKRKADPQ